MALDGLLVLADRTKLDPYVGSLANAIIPVWDGTTGLPYKIAASEVLVGADNALYPHTAIGGSVESIPGLIGKTVIAIFRGSSFALGATWDSVAGEATAPMGSDWLGMEELNLLYKI